MSVTASRFTDYIDSRTLPFSSVEVRKRASQGVVLAMVHQNPSPGVKYAPVDDLIVSFPIDSSSDLVTRDIGMGRNRFRALPGCILVTPPNVSSYWQFERRYQILHIGFPSTFLDELLGNDSIALFRKVERLPGKPLSDVLMSLLAHRCWAVASAERKHSGLFLDHALVTLLTALIAYCDTCQSSKREARPPEVKLAPWRVSRATDFMVANLGQGFTIRELAECVGLSQYHFLRAFAATTGQTPYQWLTHQRMERAKDLLRHTDRPITQIAVDLGFSSAGHFAVRFRQLLGFSPGEWRRTFSDDGHV